MPSGLCSSRWGSREDEGPRVAALLAASGLASAACRHPLRTVDLVWNRQPGVVYAVATDAPRVALTLDDGPDAAGTPAILDTLARHGARATFFLLGERVAGREALVRRIVAAGNEIGNHGMREEPAIDLPPEAFERELLEAQQRLAPFGASCWFRPGSGWYDETMLEVLARHGYRLALGSIYPLDAQLPFRGLASWWLRVRCGAGRGDRAPRRGGARTAHGSGARDPAAGPVPQGPRRGDALRARGYVARCGAAARRNQHRLPGSRRRGFMRLGFVVACLVAFVGCSGWLVREPERAVGVEIDLGPAYEQLFGRYVELCALSQYRSLEHGEGGVPGHAVMYLKGACKDESAPTPELRPCRTIATSVDDPEHGAGVSVNRWLQNANWVATPSHRLFFQGDLEEGDAVTRETVDRTVHAVIEAGVFHGVVFRPDMPAHGSLEEVVGAEFVGTDFALRMARTSYCARLPVTDAMMRDIIDYLNAVNRAYASGRAHYNWSGYSDNCAHLLHNALAAASIWRPRSVQTSKLRQIGNLSLPANEVIDLAKLGTEGPLTNAREVYRNDEARDALLNLDWLPRRHGAVMTLRAGLGAQRALRHARAHPVAPGPLPPRGCSYREAHLRRSPLHAAASEPGVLPRDLRRDARGARRTHRRRLAAAAERPLPATDEALLPIRRGAARRGRADAGLPRRPGRGGGGALDGVGRITAREGRVSGRRSGPQPRSFARPTPHSIE